MLAWLNSTPKDSKISNGEHYIDARMPYLSKGFYLIAIAIRFKIQSYSEIASWQRGTGTKLSANEFNSIYWMIGYYRAMLQEYQGSTAESPYPDFLGSDEAKSIANNNVDAMFERFKIMKQVAENG